MTTSYGSTEPPKTSGWFSGWFSSSSTTTVPTKSSTTNDAPLIPQNAHKQAKTGRAKQSLRNNFFVAPMPSVL